MNFRRVLITGGAGFVGANLAIACREHFPNILVTSFDNLSRRGSELNLPRLADHGVRFVHGDVRCAEDIGGVAPFDLLIDCAAQPSVHAGLEGSPFPVIQNNLLGTVHCAEAARRNRAAVIFLSTSRVYPIAAVNSIPFKEDPSRFCWNHAACHCGVSEIGIGEEFPLGGARSFYGATKLASELILQEYAHNYDLPVLINRCGVLAGPWQMGKVDQGVFTFWVARHLFGLPLRYTGFGGSGKQVRDLLHVDDLFDLISRQMDQVESWKGQIYNVGGGFPVSTSLLELTATCRDVTGRSVPVDAVPETASVDIRIFLTDARRAMADFDWLPHRSVPAIVEDIRGWLHENSAMLQPLFL
jgi:CDP-paratose 2-epimerase